MQSVLLAILNYSRFERIGFPKILIVSSNVGETISMHFIFRNALNSHRFSEKRLGFAKIPKKFEIISILKILIDSFGKRLGFFRKHIIICKVSLNGLDLVFDFALERLGFSKIRRKFAKDSSRFLVGFH